ncbi:MAG: hypothetical protein RLZZ517_493 [Candidatus Parcubacteria bacterium]|jgi:hypothetical protein
MQHLQQKTPSNKVGIVLVLVVLIVSLTIFGVKFHFNPSKGSELKNVELVLERKTQKDFKSGDEDKDGLSDWLEEFYKTDSKNPDTDGDGTNDGDEVAVDRDPTIKGPNDPLLTRKDVLQTEADLSNFTPGTLTDKVSVDLFKQYLLLKKQGTLKLEDQEKMLENISQNAVKESSLTDKYTMNDVRVVPSTKESITAYGDRYAQIAVDVFIKMDSYKNLEDLAYLQKIGEAYTQYAVDISTISVPDVFKDVHLALLNQLYRTGVFFEKTASAEKDPLSSIVVATQYRSTSVSEGQLYTTLANYFKNNAIIFDTDSTKNFWKRFEN